MPPETFRAEISNDKRAPKLLYDNGLLRRGEGRNYTRKPSAKLPEIGYKRCYTLVLPDEYHRTDADDFEEFYDEMQKRIQKDLDKLDI